MPLPLMPALMAAQLPPFSELLINLTEQDRMLLQRTAATRAETRIVAGYAEEVLTAYPERMQSYVEDLIEYGELRASRRGFMQHYSRDLEE